MELQAELVSVCVGNIPALERYQLKVMSHPENVQEHLCSHMYRGVLKYNQLRLKNRKDPFFPNEHLPKIVLILGRDQYG